MTNGLEPFRNYRLENCTFNSRNFRKCSLLNGSSPLVIGQWPSVISHLSQVYWCPLRERGIPPLHLHAILTYEDRQPAGSDVCERTCQASRLQASDLAGSSRRAR